MTPTDSQTILIAGIAVLFLAGIIALAVAGWRAWRGDD